MTSQWLLLALFPTVAILWVLWERSRSSGVSASARRALAEMPWREVEGVVGDYFRGRDFAVAEIERAGADAVATLVLTKRDEYYLAQCRRWRAPIVGADAVREFHRSLASRHAAGGFILTSGAFSREARELARERGIELIGAEQLAPVAAGTNRRILLNQSSMS